MSALNKRHPLTAVEQDEIEALEQELNDDDSDRALLAQELEAMKVLGEQLIGLEEPARARVLAYLNHRFTRPR